MKIISCKSYPNGGKKIKYKELTEKIIGCAYKVHNKMGYGSVYEKCLMIELKRAGLNSEVQKSITVFYDDEVVGDFKADILVENCVILELKSVKRIIKEHEVQLVNYLTATKKDIGLLLNLTNGKVKIKRKVREPSLINE